MLVSTFTMGASPRCIRITLSIPLSPVVFSPPTPVFLLFKAPIDPILCAFLHSDKSARCLRPRHKAAGSLTTIGLRWTTFKALTGNSHAVHGISSHPQQAFCQAALFSSFFLWQLINASHTLFAAFSFCSFAAICFSFFFDLILVFSMFGLALQLDAYLVHGGT